MHSYESEFVFSLTNKHTAVIDEKKTTKPYVYKANVLCFIKILNGCLFHAHWSITVVVVELIHFECKHLFNSLEN